MKFFSRKWPRWRGEATTRSEALSGRVHHVDGVLWEGERPEQPCLDRTSLGRFGGHLILSNMRLCERPVMLVVQDETIVRQFDCNKCFWGSEGMRMLLRKTDGRGLMFSGFLTEEVGVPVPTDEVLSMVNAKRRAAGKLPADKYRCMRQVDYALEGWWNSEKMVQQTDEVTDVLEAMFPQIQFAFLFDWSSGHHKCPADALIPRHMNRGPGGRQPCMRPTIIQRDEDAPLLGKGAVQSMVFAEGDVVLATGKPAVPGQPKGAEQVLRERGLFLPGMTLTGGRAKNPGMSMVARLEDCLEMSCAKTLLEEVIEQKGHMCIFGAKFHCECSAIELLWGRGKHNLRQKCDFSLESLRQNSRQAFLDVALLTIRKFFRKCRSYMRAYREGHTAISAEAQVKIYKSHRRPAPSEFLST